MNCSSGVRAENFSLVDFMIHVPQDLMIKNMSPHISVRVISFYMNVVSFICLVCMINFLELFFALYGFEMPIFPCGLHLILLQKFREGKSQIA